MKVGSNAPVAIITDTNTDLARICALEGIVNNLLPLDFRISGY
jgi:hypothetical protein